MKLLALAVVLASLSSFAGSAWEGQLAEARKKAMVERKKLGLSDDKLRAAYPTPEVHFGASDRDVGVVCPGKSVVVKGKGKLLAGSAVVARTDDVEVTGSSVKGGGFEATVKAKAGMPPGPVTAEVAAPVSFTSDTVLFVFVGCGHSWRIELDNGEVLTFKTNWTKAGALTLEGDWTKAGKAEGKMKCRVDAESIGSYSIERDVSQEEQMGQANAMMAAMNSKEMKALQARQAAATKDLGACTKLPPAQMEGCMKGPAEKMKVVGAEMEALMNGAKARASPTFGCSSLHVNVEGGKLSGDASSCVGEKSARITGGTLTAN